jgi:hypothetical protein
MATLVSTAEYKAWRGITVSTYDSIIATLLGWVSTDIRRYCGRDLTNGFESATRTETYAGSGDIYIQLREWPITSITSVTQVYAGGDTSVVDADTYRVDADNGLLACVDARRGRFASWQVNASNGYAGNWLPAPNFTEGFLNYSVVYVGGYSTIPADLHMATCLLTDLLYTRRGVDLSLKSENIGQYSYTRADAPMVAQIRKDLLAPFNNGTP